MVNPAPLPKRRKDIDCTDHGLFPLKTLMPEKFSRVVSVILLLAASAAAATSPASHHYVIGTGSRGATFYPMMEALCHHINRTNLGFTCEAVATPGSEYNLRGIESGELDLGLSQANLQYLAFRGQPPFDSRQQHIRTVAALHQEVFTLVALTDSGISHLDDLKGRRVNIGNPGSGSRLITERMLQFLGWDLDDFVVYDHKSSQLPELFCHREIDAAIYSTGHPNAIYRQLMTECDVALLDLWDSDIAAFVESSEEFGPAVIPGDTYPGVTTDKHGFGVQVVLSAHQALPEVHVDRIVQVLVEQRRELARRAIIYNTVDAQNSISQPVAPYHPGAVSSELHTYH